MKQFFLVVFLLVGLAVHAADPKPRRLLAGAATSNITPEIGAIIVGGFDPFPATHIHDELHARCLVLACETFVETGLELKAKSPFKPSFTHSIANGYYGYMPTPEHHRLGGYETWLGTNRLEEQASVKITEALLAMWNEMR